MPRAKQAPEEVVLPAKGAGERRNGASPGRPVNSARAASAAKKQALPPLGTGEHSREALTGTRRGASPDGTGKRSRSATKAAPAAKGRKARVETGPQKKAAGKQAKAVAKTSPAAAEKASKSEHVRRAPAGADHAPTEHARRGGTAEHAPDEHAPGAAKGAKAHKVGARAGHNGALGESPPAVSRAAVKEEPSDALFRQHQRELLVAERNNYTRQAEELRAQAEALALEHEPGDVQFDEEGGEGGTANVDRELDLHLSAQAQAAIEEIDAALAKIDDRTYGFCENCGAPIPRARLEALPHARLCVACKSGGLATRRQ